MDEILNTFPYLVDAVTASINGTFSTGIDADLRLL
jgi:hypothetical protein